MPHGVVHRDEVGECRASSDDRDEGENGEDGKSGEDGREGRRLCERGEGVSWESGGESRDSRRLFLSTTRELLDS